MKLYNTEGIIFRTVKYGESSLILDIYTLESGLASFIVSGVRSAKSRAKANLYRPGHIIEFSAYHAESNRLSRIKEANYRFHFQSLMQDVVKSSVLTFLVEVCRNSIVEREANPELYHFIADWFIYLDTQPGLHPCMHHLFMIGLSSFLGFEPMNNFDDHNSFFDLAKGEFVPSASSYNCLDKEESMVLTSLLNCRKEDADKIKFPVAVRKQLLLHLLDYYRLHLSYFREVLSVRVLTEVFM
jgi:DNA repair protein RecO (recombination protein O)